MPLVSVLADMEWEGVCIDEALLSRLSQRVHQAPVWHFEGHLPACRRRIQPQFAQTDLAWCFLRNSTCPNPRRPRPACPPTLTPWRNCRTAIPWCPSCSNTARCRSFCQPTSTRWGRRCSLRAAGSTPRSTRPLPRPAGCRARTPICRTSRCAPTRAAPSARRLSRRQERPSSRPTTRR